MINEARTKNYLSKKEEITDLTDSFTRWIKHGAECNITSHNIVRRKKKKFLILYVKIGEEINST